MKLGLITDIHEHVDNLKVALDCFKTERADRIVVIGDLFALGKRINETCRLLSEAAATGVWGNHDYGLCVDPEIDVCARFGADAFTYLPTLRPRLEVADCYFSHVEPWLNPEEIADLWYFEEPLTECWRRDRIFNAVSHRTIFAGHYHRWLLVTPDGIADWQGEEPIRLSDGRHFVVIGAACEGRFALFDTETRELIPFNLPRLEKRGVQSELHGNGARSLPLDPV